jgi:hypothetical protein
MAQLTILMQLAHSKASIALLALATHFVFHTDEWDYSLHVFFAVWTAAFGGLAVVSYGYEPQPTTIGGALLTATSTAALYFGVLVTSIVLHRGFFHRLRKVCSPSPGPYMTTYMSADSWSVSRKILQALYRHHRCPTELPILQENRRMAQAVQVGRYPNRAT